MGVLGPGSVQNWVSQVDYKCISENMMRKKYFSKEFLLERALWALSVGCPLEVKKSSGHCPETVAVQDKWLLNHCCQVGSSWNKLPAM